MSDKKEKTLSYRRAEWLHEGKGLTLEKCTREMLAKLNTVEKRSILSSGELYACTNHQQEPNGGLFLHLVHETPGESASWVPKAGSSAAQLRLKTAPPPTNGEWLDSDAFLYIDGNHVCLCSSAVRDGSITRFLKELFRLAKIRKDAVEFELFKAADISKVRMIQKLGVKEIEIKATLQKASLHYSKRTDQSYGILDGTAKRIRSFFKKENDYTEDALRVAITISTDGRMTKGLKLGEKRIEELAIDLVKHAEDDDDFSIITLDNQRISPKEIFMRAKASIDSEGKTVNLEKAWDALKTFYKRLESSGAFEQ